MAVGEINQYTCKTCGKHIVTVDRDDGTTPFMIACQRSPACPGPMASHAYRVSQDLHPSHEWYKPVGKVKPAYRHHVAMGGLLLRPIALDPEINLSADPKDPDANGYTHQERGVRLEVWDSNSLCPRLFMWRVRVWKPYGDWGFWQTVGSSPSPLDYHSAVQQGQRAFGLEIAKLDGYPVTVSPEAKERLMREYGLTEADFYSVNEDKEQ